MSWIIEVSDGGDAMRVSRSDDRESVFSEDPEPRVTVEHDAAGPTVIEVIGDPVDAAVQGLMNGLIASLEPEARMTVQRTLRQMIGEAHSHAQANAG